MMQWNYASQGGSEESRLPVEIPRIAFDIKCKCVPQKFLLCWINANKKAACDWFLETICPRTKHVDLQEVTFSKCVFLNFSSAPEVLMGKQYDTKVDMWAVGVIAYILWVMHNLSWKNLSPPILLVKKVI